jgi:hypothetical protein
VCSRICAAKIDVDDLLAKLKITPCPHCKRIGFLNRHGLLLGYTLNQLGNTVRAACAVRVYCSNRHPANGCGRTFSVWTADKIKHLFLSAESLWQFLSDAVRSGNIVQAFRNLKSGLNDPAAYRIWRRFLNAQVAIRTALLALCEPPQNEALPTFRLKDKDKNKGRFSEASRSSCATIGITKGPSSSTKTDAALDKPGC